MNNRVFTDINSLELIIKHRKHAVILEKNPDQMVEKRSVTYNFEPKEFNTMLDYIKRISNDSWVNLVPKKADTLGSDYYEYYDRYLDNNGYLTIRENSLIIERPFRDSSKLYQFNKLKMQSFIYDFEKLLGGSVNDYT